MKKFRFLEWKVYTESQNLFSFILKLVKKLPKEFRFELSSQIIRSSHSILLNIAEGSGKASDKELNRFIEIALGSLYETVACADSLRRNDLISEEDFSTVLKYASSIGDQLGGFKKKL